jgi:hypothetical protein
MIYKGKLIVSNEKEKNVNKDLESKKEKVVDISSKEKKVEKAEKSNTKKAPKKTQKKPEVEKAKSEKKASKNTKASKPKAKKLTLDALNKENKKLDNRVVGKIMVNGSEYEVEYDSVFRTSKQQKVLDDILKFYEQVDTLGTKILDIATPYFVMVIIKHFTSVEVPDSIEDAMDTMSVLIDLEILHEILNMLPEKEVEKVNKLIEDALEIFKANIAEADAELRKMAENGEIKNPKELGLDDSGEEVDLNEYPLEEDTDKPLN